LRREISEARRSGSELGRLAQRPPQREVRGLTRLRGAEPVGVSRGQARREVHVVHPPALCLCLEDRGGLLEQGVLRRRWSPGAKAEAYPLARPCDDRWVGPRSRVRDGSGRRRRARQRPRDATEPRSACRVMTRRGADVTP
jgi:hypothetical protein